MPPWFHLIRYVVEFFLYAVQVSLVYLVVRQQKRRIHNYGSGFFDVFLCKTLIEIAEFSAAVLYLRVPAMAAIPKEAVSPALVMSYYVFNCFLMYGQEMCHAMIAVDRYVIFRYPTEKRLSRRRLRIYVCFALCVALVASCPRLFAKPFLIESGGNLVVVNMDKTAQAVSNTIGITFAVATSVVSAVLDVKSYLIFRRWVATRRKTYRHELRLLLYSMLQLFGQLLLTGHYVFGVVVTAAGAPDSPLRQVFNAFTLTVQPFMLIIFCLISGVCLLVTCEAVRNDFAKLYGLTRLSTKLSPAGHTQTVRSFS